MSYRLLLPLLLCCLLAPVPGLAAPTLQRLSKQEDPMVTRLQLDFDALPSYRIKTSGQRIDLLLAGASADTALSDLPEGGSVIRILLGHRQKELMVSFLLAGPPQEVKLEADPSRQQLSLTLSWGRTPSPARPAISATLPAPRPSSSYTGRWLEFFREYEVLLAVPVPLRPSLVGLPTLKYHPLGSDAPAQQLRAAIELSSQGEWGAALAALGRLQPGTLQGADREALLLFHGEALCRGREYASARTLLEDYLQAYADSPLAPRARFLLCLALAGDNEPYQALVRIDQYTQTAGGWPAAYLGALVLLRAELALLTGRPQQALALLDQLPLQAPVLEARRQLRRADALAASGKMAEALVLYRGWGEQSSLWAEEPAALARFAEALHVSGDWLGAAQRYLQLAEQMGETEALATFGAARNFLRAEDLTQGLPLLAASLTEGVGQEAGWRARLLELDRALLSGAAPKGLATAERYGALVRTAPNRALAEEAAFKRLLTLAVSGMQPLCLQELPDFFRRYSSGSLRKEGEALLVELLPGVLEDLLARGEDLPALVLVEQHREFLVSSGVSAPFLLRLGDAFERLGLLEKAQKVYGYLFEGMAGRSEQAAFYLPLARVHRDRRQPSQALSLIERYLSAYPKGEDRSTLLLLQGELLYAQGKLEQAVKVLTLLGEALPPSGIELLAKSYWELGRLEEAERAFAKVGQGQSGVARNQALALQAESLYRQQRGEEALSLYQELAADGAFADQALYRSAQIHLAAGRRAQALKFLQRLVDEGRSPRWKQLAGELLELQSLTGR